MPRLTHLILIFGLIGWWIPVMVFADDFKNANPAVYDRKVIIDHVWIESDSGASGLDLARTLGITVGQPVNSEQLALELSEAERRLKASGKYGENVSLKLDRGKEYPHAILVIHGEEQERWYVGAEAGFLRDPYERDSNSYFRQNQRGRQWHAGAYTGTRNWFDTGLAIDIDLMNHNFSIEQTFDGGEYSFDYNLSALGVTLLNNNLFNRRFFAGGTLRLLHFTSRFDSDSTYRYEVPDYKYEYSNSRSESESEFVGGGEVIAGARFSKLTVVGTHGRTFMRRYNRKFDSKSHRTVNDVPDESYAGDDYDYDQEGDGYRVNRDMRLSANWSDKSRLSLIEPGLDATASWRRYGSDIQLEKPDVAAFCDYTFLLSDDFGLTFSGGEKWDFGDGDSWDPALRRVYQLGVKTDYVTDRRWVVFGEFYRIGGLRSELGGSVGSGLSLRSRASIGLKYASTSMVYALTAAYGPETLNDGMFGGSDFGLSSVYSRVGIK